MTKVELSERDRGAVDSLRAAALAQTKIRETYMRHIEELATNHGYSPNFFKTRVFWAKDEKLVDTVKFLNDIADAIEQGNKTLDAFIKFTSNYGETTNAA